MRRDGFCDPDPGRERCGRARHAASVREPDYAALKLVVGAPSAGAWDADAEAPVWRVLSEKAFGRAIRAL